MNVTELRCCEPVYRDHPSRVRKYHAATCPVSPGAEIVKPSRAEVASHAVRTEDDYETWYSDYWSDRAFEQEGGR
jgi:hypothetical protein